MLLHRYIRLPAGAVERLRGGGNRLRALQVRADKLLRLGQHLWCDKRRANLQYKTPTGEVDKGASARLDGPADAWAEVHALPSQYTSQLVRPLSSGLVRYSVASCTVRLLQASMQVKYKALSSPLTWPRRVASSDSFSFSAVSCLILASACCSGSVRFHESTYHP